MRYVIVVELPFDNKHMATGPYDTKEAAKSAAEELGLFGDQYELVPCTKP